MSCYVHNLADLFAEAGVENTKQSRKRADGVVRAALGMPDAHCPEIWRELKVWLQDAANRQELVSRLRDAG
jgi:hypothetical protein